MRHIKLRGTLSRDKKYVTIHILEQTHHGSEFGAVKGENQSHFVGPNGFYLYSDNGRPEAWDRRIYLRGYHEHSRAPELSVTVPLADWEKIKVAVQAYNEFYA